MPRMLSWNVSGKRVFLRADLNTCFNAELFRQSLKFQRLLPTLLYLKQRGARITLATHSGRPHGYEADYSTRKLTEHFIQAGFSCVWSSIENLSHTLQEYAHADIILLENLRFYHQEEEKSIEFAKKISQAADFFVEDGFGVLAREETSVITVAQLFNPAHRSYGFLIQAELEQLRPLKNGAKKPYMVMVGGSKGLEKLATLYHFFSTATDIALCPGLSELPEAASFIRDAHKAHINILIPRDYIRYKGTQISIGPETLSAWHQRMSSMHTIIYNGMMGMLEYPETTLYTRKLFELFGTLKATTVVAGGQTSLAAQLWNIHGKNLFVSTGGGSTLAYLSHQPLPGLTLLNELGL